MGQITQVDRLLAPPSRFVEHETIGSISITNKSVCSNNHDGVTGTPLTSVICPIIINYCRSGKCTVMSGTVGYKVSI